jgi:hypothetical protein
MRHSRNHAVNKGGSHATLSRMLDCRRGESKQSNQFTIRKHKRPTSSLSGAFLFASRDDVETDRSASRRHRAYVAETKSAIDSAFNPLAFGYPSCLNQNRNLVSVVHASQIRATLRNPLIRSTVLNVV